MPRVVRVRRESAGTAGITPAGLTSAASVRGVPGIVFIGVVRGERPRIGCHGVCAVIADTLRLANLG